MIKNVDKERHTQLQHPENRAVEKYLLIIREFLTGAKEKDEEMQCFFRKSSQGKVHLYFKIEKMFIKI